MVVKVAKNKYLEDMIQTYEFLFIFILNSDNLIIY